MNLTSVEELSGRRHGLTPVSCRSVNSQKLKTVNSTWSRDPRACPACEKRRTCYCNGRSCNRQLAGFLWKESRDFLTFWGAAKCEELPQKRCILYFSQYRPTDAKLLNFELGCHMFLLDQYLLFPVIKTNYQALNLWLSDSYFNSKLKRKRPNKARLLLFSHVCLCVCGRVNNLKNNFGVGASTSSCDFQDGFESHI